MYTKLEALIENYNQAFQNFNLAEKEYQRKAICELTIAESLLEEELDERSKKQCMHFTFCSASGL
jgi:hypothetical protein